MNQLALPLTEKVIVAPYRQRKAQPNTPLVLQQGDDRWYTPALYADAAREVMGSIELDPASCEEANQYVKADRFFTIYDNGLKQDWTCKTLWLNPPGSSSRGKSNTTIWGERLIEAYKSGMVQQALMMVYRVGIETEFWQSIMGEYPYCIPNQRIKFIPPAGKYADPSKNSPTHGSAIVYFGQSPDRFNAVFAKFGKVEPYCYMEWLQKLKCFK